MWYEVESCSVCRKKLMASSAAQYEVDLHTFKLSRRKEKKHWIKYSFGVSGCNSLRDLHPLMPGLNLAHGTCRVVG